MPLIHVVDDDPAMRESLCYLLRAFGWSAQGFADGQGFLAELETSAPDCLLLDLHLRGSSGVEVLEALRKHGSSVPVIAITGAAEDPNLVQRALAAGAREVLPKPVPDERLRRAIERVLG